MEDNKNQDQQKMEAIYQKLVQVEKNLVENFYRSQVERDMTNHLEVNQKLSHEDFAKNLRNYFQDKYYWMTWGAHVYNPIEGYEVHAVHCLNTSTVGCQFVWRKFSRNVVVSWSDLNTTNAELAIQQFHENKDNMPCEKNAEKLNDMLWDWDGIKERKLVLVVQDSADLVSVHGADEVEAIHCSGSKTIFTKEHNFKLIFGF